MFCVVEDQDVVDDQSIREDTVINLGDCCGGMSDRPLFWLVLTHVNEKVRIPIRLTLQ